tara:strand:- start:498 stop:1163 length:666 start_codon:yes stop_codon:yes gene_type:complete
MKFPFKLFFLLLIFCNPVWAEISVGYLIKTKGVSIGKMYWTVDTEDGFYNSSIKLDSTGFFSNLYKFSGRYKSSGLIQNKSFTTKKYIQEWNTSQKKKIVEIDFDKNKIIKLSLSPNETENPRLDFLNLEGYKDPVTSFLTILYYGKESLTIDGRRTYLLAIEKKPSFIKITTKNFNNIWADHKRNDLSYINIYSENEGIFPDKIEINFKGGLFVLKRFKI